MYKIKLKKSKDKIGGKNAYRKKRKEKKSKGLFYLIFTLTIIAALTISCKNKPTGTNEFAWEDVDIKVPNSGTIETPKYEIKTKEDWKVLLGKTLISEEDLNPGTGVPTYFWAEFTTEGIKYRLGDSKDTKPNFSSQSAVSLNIDAFNDNKANFTGKDSNGKTQTGSISYIIDTDGTITDFTVTFTEGVAEAYKKAIKCGKPKELN